MQYNLNTDVAIWLDSVRGAMSRQQFITSVLRQHMQSTQSTKENNEAHHTNGAIDALSQN